MRLVLDTPVRVRGHRVAALCRSGVSLHAMEGGLAGFGVKTPVAILIARAGAMQAFAPDGSTLDRAALEALAPGIWDQFAVST